MFFFFFENGCFFFFLRMGQTIECNLSIRFCVIFCRRLGSRNDLSSVMVAERAQ